MACSYGTLRKRTTEAADGGDEHAQQMRVAERECIVSRFGEHSAGSRRERRQRINERAQTFAHEGGSVLQRLAAESQRRQRSAIAVVSEGIGEYDIVTHY